MLRIITYHRVDYPKNSKTLNPRMISATPEVFQAHVRYLASKYHVVSMEEVLHAFEQKKSLPRRAVLITFDDAYCDFGTIAWPILKALRLPVTVFVPTGYPGRPELAFWWDKLFRAFAQSSMQELQNTPIGSLPLQPETARIQSLKRVQNYVKTLAHEEAMEFVDEVCEKLGAKETIEKSVLDWDELRKLAREGVTLGAHTRTHPIMTRLPTETIRLEIIDSRADLAREVGEPLPIFCYPSGGHSDEVVEILQQENFKLAVTTLDGHNDLRSADPFRLHRTNITRKTTPSVFRLRLTRWMTAIDSWRHRNDQAVVSVRG